MSLPSTVAAITSLFMGANDPQIASQKDIDINAILGDVSNTASILHMDSGDIKGLQLAQSDPFDSILEGLLTGKSPEEILQDIITPPQPEETTRIPNDVFDNSGSAAPLRSQRPLARPNFNRQRLQDDFSNRTLTEDSRNLITTYAYIPPRAIVFSSQIGANPSSLDNNYYFDIMLTNGQEICGRIGADQHDAPPEIAGATFVQPVSCNEQWDGPLR